MPKTILYLGNFYASLGHQGPSVELVEKLQLRGWKILTSSSLRYSFLRVPAMLGSVLFKSASYQTAIVEIYSGRAFWWAEACVYLLNMLKKKLILVLHGGDLPEFSMRNPTRVKNVFSKAARIISPSLYLKTKLIEIDSSIEVIPNGIELSGFRVKVRKNILPNLIWVRSFHSIYNPCLAVRVLADLAEDYPGASLTFVGPDKRDGALEEVRRLAAQLGMEKKISFYGPVNKREIPALLEKADIFLNTSNIDNMPVTVIEAMAGGLCVVSTDAGGLPYLIESQHDGILVPVNDAGQMKEAVASLLITPELSEKVSKNASEKVKNFDWPSVLSQWENLLESA